MARTVSFQIERVNVSLTARCGAASRDAPGSRHGADAPAMVNAAFTLTAHQEIRPSWRSWAAGRLHPSLGRPNCRGHGRHAHPDPADRLLGGRRLRRMARRATDRPHARPAHDAVAVHHAAGRRLGLLPADPPDGGAERTAAAGGAGFLAGTLWPAGGFPVSPWTTGDPRDRQGTDAGTGRRGFLE